MSKKNKDILIWGTFGLVAVASLYLISIFASWFSYQDKAFPGVSVAGINVTGKNKAEIIKILEDETKTYLATDINFASDKPVLVKPADLSMAVDASATAEAAIVWGEKHPFAIGQKQDFPILYKFDQAKLYQTINQISEAQVTPAEDPQITLVDSELKVSPGQIGKRVNYASTAANFLNSTGRLVSKVDVSTFQISPSFTPEQALAKKEEILAKTKTIILSGAGQEISVGQNEIVKWASVTGEQPVFARIMPGEGIFQPLTGNTFNGSLFAASKIETYLKGIAPKIDRNPVNAQLTISGGRASVFVPSQDGRTLNVAATSENIQKSLNSGLNKAELAVTITNPEITENSLNDMGITELISTGYSSFTGSPKNRIHNVRVGAAKFNGVLIKPGQTLSFIKTLGPVDASTGYLPELVILENKTKPEYGGGMCQVSSTAFRAALNAGLPIVARKNHSYPVSYYKPFGVDATVYIPSPDLQFTNDTGKYILIQTHIEGTKLTFDFYGTKPKRTVTFAGNGEATGAVPIVEKVSPAIYDKEARGRASFTAAFWRFIYDESGQLIKKSTWVSKYDSPDKYPH